MSPANLWHNVALIYKKKLIHFKRFRNDFKWNMKNKSWILFGGGFVGITKRGASRRVWLAEANRKWPRPTSSTPLPITSERIPPCLPGKFATDCSPRASATRRTSPASAPSIGKSFKFKLYIAVHFCHVALGLRLGLVQFQNVNNRFITIKKQKYEYSISINIEIE